MYMCKCPCKHTCIFHILHFPGISWNYIIHRKLPGNEQDFPEFGKFPSKWKHWPIVCHVVRLCCMLQCRPPFLIILMVQYFICPSTCHWHAVYKFIRAVVQKSWQYYFEFLISCKHWVVINYQWSLTPQYDEYQRAPFTIPFTIICKIYLPLKWNNWPLNSTKLIIIYVFTTFCMSGVWEHLWEKVWKCLK